MGPTLAVVEQDSAASRAGRRELVALTGSRFVVGLGLFVVHAVFFARLAGTDPAWFEHAVAVGRAGMTYFLALSGFLLTYAYGRRLARPEAPSLVRFYGARVAALWPIHLLGLLLLLPLYVDDLFRAPVELLAALLANVALVHGLLPFQVGDQSVTLAFNTPSWSMSTLVACYLALPPALWMLDRVLRVSTRGLVLVASGCWLATIGAAFAFRADPTAAWAFHYFPPLRFSEFLAGACLGLYAIRRRDAEGDGHAGRRAPPRRPVVASVRELAAVGTWFGWAILGTALPEPIRAAWSLPAMLLLAWTLALGGGIVARVLGSRPARRLGARTLAFAMLHFPVLVYASAFGAFERLGVLPTVALGLGASLMVAELAHRWIELPAKVAIRGRVGAWVDTVVPVDVDPDVAQPIDELAAGRHERRRSQVDRRDAA